MFIWVLFAGFLTCLFGFWFSGEVLGHYEHQPFWLAAFVVLAFIGAFKYGTKAKKSLPSNKEESTGTAGTSAAGTTTRFGGGDGAADYGGATPSSGYHNADADGPA